MSIDDIRMNQRSQQSSAIKLRRDVEGVVRIGDRDPITGRYQVLEPDGGIDPNGIKVFNSQEQYGDRVLPFRRLDGAIGIDSEKGSKARTPTAFPKCPGYLASQVFNCEEPPKKKQKSPIHVLYFSDGNYWVGGHQEIPELVIFPSGTSGNAFFKIWADSEGWTVSGRDAGGGNICSVTSDGSTYFSATTPESRFLAGPLASLSGDFGNGNFQLRSSDSFQGNGNSYIWSEGQWTFRRVPDGAAIGTVIDLPFLKFPGKPTIFRTNELAADFSRYWFSIGVDRDSAIITFTDENSLTGIIAGFFELISINGSVKRFLNFSENTRAGTGTPPANLNGTYTEKVFTNIQGAGVTPLKTQDSTITVNTTVIDQTDPINIKAVTSQSTAIGFKIPGNASILSSCSARLP